MSLEATARTQTTAPNEHHVEGTTRAVAIIKSISPQTTNNPTGNRVPTTVLPCCFAMLALLAQLVGSQMATEGTATVQASNASHQLNQSALVQFDDHDDDGRVESEGEEDDDEEDPLAAVEDEEEYLEDEEFYNNSELPEMKLARDRPEGEQEFDDIKIDDSEFDDHTEFKTSEFYSNSTSRRPAVFKGKPEVKLKRFRAPQVANSSMGSAAAAPSETSARQARRGRVGAGAGCALLLARGHCITYQSLEWAIGEARRLINYRRPAGLEAAESNEFTIGRVGELNEMSTRLLAARHQLDQEEISRQLEAIDVSRTSLWRECPRFYKLAPVCPPFSRYRSHSGRCNNLAAPLLGAANMPFARLQPADYGDGVGFVRGSSLAVGKQLPPARLLAIHLHGQQLELPAGDLSALFVSWGQLINHDLAQASTARDSTGHEHKCCHRRRSKTVLGRQDVDSYLTNCLPIMIPPDDPVYGPFGVRCHEFKRSLAGLRPACSLGPRTQINTITSYVDASFVYGSSASVSGSLRARRGQLDMRDHFASSSLKLKPLLPAQSDNPDDECIGRHRAGRYCFRSGDARTNQQIQLVVLHTIHARQHNRLVAGLAQLNPHWSGERLYQEARHIHIALVQHILLSEYLPELLGRPTMDKFNLNETPSAEWWSGYDPSLNAGISQEFAAAAFRQGHTSVPSQVFRFNPLSHEPLRAYPLRRLFRQPWPLYEPGAVDEFLAGLVDVAAKSQDPFMTEELSGHLLEVPGEPVGLDLASINIQRGRDQGVAGYNSFREWCGLGRVSNFEELANHMSNGSSFLMGQLYESVDDIDLFTGGASEFPLEGAQVGPTFACLIGRQFELLRAGDRFWFELGPEFGPQAFRPDQLASIKQVSLARLLCVNSDSHFDVQPHAFRLAHPILNARQPCDSLPDLDLALWFEPAGANSDD